MNIHMYSTDVSCFELVDSLAEDDAVTCVIVPSNRRGADKIALLLQEAERRDIPVHEHQLRSAVGDDLPEADAGVSWLYSQIIRTDDINRYPRGLLNMHGGIIPDYRGASVLHWAIVNGEQELGVTWHEIVEAVDAGGIWGESRIPIHEADTALDVRVRLVREGVRLFPQAWARFKARDGKPRFPDLEKGTVWPQRKPAHSHIEPGWDARRVKDLVRAMCPPWPRAFVEDGGVTVRIDHVADQAVPGSIRYETSCGRVLYLVPEKEEPSC